MLPSRSSSAMARSRGIRPIAARGVSRLRASRSTTGSMRDDAAVWSHPGRQPWRDRHPRLSRLSRARHRDGRRLFRGRCWCATRALRRRGRATWCRRAERELPQYPQVDRRRQAHGCAGDPSGLRLSGRERSVCDCGRGGRSGLDWPAAERHRRDGFEDQLAHPDGQRRRTDRAWHDRGDHGPRPRRRVGRAVRLADCAQGLGRWWWSRAQGRARGERGRASTRGR